VFSTTWNLLTLSLSCQRIAWVMGNVQFTSVLFVCPTNCNNLRTTKGQLTFLNDQRFFVVVIPYLTMPYHHHRAVWWTFNTVDLYYRRIRFEFRPRYRLSQLKFSCFSHYLPGNTEGSGRVKNFHFFVSSRPTLGSGTGREAYHSRLTSAGVNKIWIYTSTLHTPSWRSA
jgi:hypothetical protein